MLRTLTRLTLVIAALLAISGCKPEYPKCNNDEDCKAGEFCVNGMCQQCRDNKDCKESETCKGGRCERKAGWCDTMDDCPNGGACKNHKCVPCQSDGDCGSDGKCRNGRCLRPGQCATDADCPENHECQNGTCVGPPTGGGAAKCTPEPVYFDFNEHVLTTAATSKLQQAAKCIKSVSGRKLRLEGHTDPRGTEEYNLALGDRRARSVLKYLKRLGVNASRMRPVSKGKLEATGTNEASWARDRKVVFIWE